MRASCRLTFELRRSHQAGEGSGSEGLGTMRCGLDDDSSAVAQDLGKTSHAFGGAVVHGDDGIRALLPRVLAHEARGVRSGPFAQVGVDGDIAAKERLQATEEVANYRTRSDGDAANDAEVADHSVAGQREG